MSASHRRQSFERAAQPLILPSLLGCHFARIDRELEAIATAGAVAVHLDVMDGHFVPNLTYGPPLVADWRRTSSLFFDAHLMMSNPAAYVDAFMEAGCDQITIHIEAVPQPVGVLRNLQNAGVLRGLALNPPTPLEAIVPFLDEVDQVLVMSVMPGFGGQAFNPSVLPKIAALRALRPDLPIVVDGGIKPSNAREVTHVGATRLVVGSAIFRPDGKYEEAYRELVRAARGPEVRDASGADSP